MKKRIQELINSKLNQLSMLKIKRDTAEALSYHTECSAISSCMKIVNDHITELNNLIK